MPADAVSPGAISVLSRLELRIGIERTVNKIHWDRIALRIESQSDLRATGNRALIFKSLNRAQPRQRERDCHCVPDKSGRPSPHGRAAVALCTVSRHLPAARPTQQTDATGRARRTAAMPAGASASPQAAGDAADPPLRLLHLEAEAAAQRAAASDAAGALDKARRRVAGLEDVLEETEAETLALKARADEAAARADSLAEDLAARDAELAAATKAAEDAAAARAEARAAAEAAGDGVAELEEQLRGAVGALASAREENQALRAEAAAAREAEATASKAAAAAKEAGVAAKAAEDEAGTLKRQLAEQSQALGAVTCEAREARAERDALVKEVDELKARAHASEVALGEMRAAEAETRKAVEEILGEREALEGELSAVKAVAEEGVLQAQNDAAEAIGELQTEVDSMEERLKEAGTRCSLVTAEKAEIMKSLNVVTAERDAKESFLQQQIDDLSLDRDELMSFKRDAEVRCTQEEKSKLLLERAVAELTAKRDELASSTSTALSDKAKLMEVVAASKKEIRDLVSSRDELAGSVKTSEQANEALKLKAQTLEAENDDGLALLNSSNNKISRLSERLAALEAENADLRKHMANSNDLMQQMEAQGTEMSKRTAAAVASADAARATEAKRADLAEEREKAIASALASIHSQLATLTGSDAETACFGDDVPRRLEHVDDSMVALKSRVASLSSLEDEMRSLSEEKQILESTTAELEQKCSDLKERALADASAAAQRLSAIESSREELSSIFTAMSQKLFHLSGVEVATTLEDDLSGYLKSFTSAVATLELRFSEMEESAVAATSRADVERRAALERASSVEESHKTIETMLHSIYTRLSAFGGKGSSSSLPSDLPGQLEHIDDALQGVESMITKLSSVESEIRSVVEQRDETDKARAALEKKCLTIEEDSKAQVVAACHRADVSEADYKAVVCRVEAISKKLYSLPGVEISATSALDDSSPLDLLATATDKMEGLLAASSSSELKASALSGEVASLTAANGKLNEKVHAVESEKSELVKELGKTSNSVDDLEGEVKRLSLDRTNLEDAVAGLRRDLDEVQKEAEVALEQQEAVSANQLRESERAFEVTLSNLRAAQNSLESTLEKREEEVEELKAREDEAAKTLGEVLADKDLLEHKVTDTHDEIVRLNGKLYAQVAESQETVESLQRELEKVGSIRALESQTQEKLVDDAVSEAEAWQGKCGSLESELCETKRELMSAEATSLSFRSRLEDSHLKSAALLIVVSECDKRAGKVDETEIRAEKAEAEVSRLQREVSAVRQDLTENFETELQLAEESFNEAIRDHANEKEYMIDRHVKELEKQRMNFEQSLVQARDECERLSSEIELLRCEAENTISKLTQKEERSASQLKSLEVRAENACALSEKLKSEKILVEEDLSVLKASTQRLEADLSVAQGKALSLSAEVKVSEENLSRALEAIAALEEQLASASNANAVAGVERDDEVTALQVALAEFKVRDASQSENVAKIRRECDAATSKLAFVESKLMPSLEKDIQSLREGESDLQTIISDRDCELSALKESLAGLDQEVANRKQAEERLQLADAALAAKDAVAEKLVAASSDLKGDIDQLRSVLKDREASFADATARISTLESECESKGEAMHVLDQKLQEQSRLLSEADVIVHDLKSKLEAAERNRQSNEAQSSAVSVGEDKSEQLYEALEKYDEALVKESRLRKRARKFEALLVAERKKTADLVAANSDLVAASKPHRGDNTYCTDRDHKRQVSPSTKGMSPSVKRARDQVFRTPLSPVATNSRPPLAPRPRP